jgi:hypothetical protein
LYAAFVYSYATAKSVKIRDMPEKPESAKIYQFSDAIDEHLDSRQAKLIATAENFKELFIALTIIGEIKGTQHLYFAEDLEVAINSIRALQNTHPEDADGLADELLILPRMFGLRAKVGELLGLNK